MSQTKSPAVPSPAQVEQYLRSHPEFFSRKTRHKLLEQLTIPHPTAGHISLIEYQVQQLRSSNRELVDQMKKLLFVQEANDRTRHGFVSILNSLFAAPDLAALLQNLELWWRNTFDQIATVRLLVLPGRVAGCLADAQVVEVMKPKTRPPELLNACRSGQHQLGNKFSPELTQVFANPAIESFLLLPDLEGHQRACLLLGSNSAKRFVAGLSADVAVAAARACIQRCWDLLAIEAKQANKQVAANSIKPRRNSTGPTRANKTVH